jgi:nucleoside triphosphate diphosphatase
MSNNNEIGSVPDISHLVEIMDRLRAPVGGCPWDVEQTFATIAPYTIEEAYEVVDAIERVDMAALQDELGDLLLQVVFHAQMAKEAQIFDVQDVINGICDKMIRRHPHVFAGAEANSTNDVVANWEDIKAAERQGLKADISAMADVAMALPALLRAQKLQKRAARTGFDWPDISGAFDKLHEEIDEVHKAKNDEERFEEMGDLLFAAVNVSRHLGIDAESALKAANVKFEKRFRHMENDAGDAFTELSLDQKEALWNRAKRK